MRSNSPAEFTVVLVGAAKAAAVVMVEAGAVKGKVYWYVIVAARFVFCGTPRIPILWLLNCGRVLGVAGLAARRYSCTMCVVRTGTRYTHARSPVPSPLTPEQGMRRLSGELR